ncbi:MAG: diguanylate cyclase [Magnetococcales bacterium]|nr:diguanylate cyclase [Magnetococcales bacterium]
MEPVQVLIVDRSRLYATVLQRDLLSAIAGSSGGEEEPPQITTLSGVADATVWLTHMGRSCRLVILDPESDHQETRPLLDLCVQRRVAVLLFSALPEETLYQIVAKDQAVDYILKENPSSVDQVVALAVRLIRNRTVHALVVDTDGKRQQQLMRWLRQQQLQVGHLKQVGEVTFFMETHPNVRLVLCSGDLSDLSALMSLLRQRYSRNDLAILGVMSPSRSAKSPQADTVRMIKRGANDLVYWPVGPQELLFRVSSALDAIDRVQAMQAVAVTDALTGLFSLKYLEESGRKLLACDKRGQLRLCVAMIEVDGFRHIAAHNTRLTVNLILKRIAIMIRDFFRNTDIIGCYSPSRFCALLIDMDPEYVREFFERLCRSVQDEEFTVRGRSIQVNISIGVQLRPLESIQDTFVAASHQLINAQLHGGNQVQIAS